MKKTVCVVRLKGAPIILPYGFKKRKVKKVIADHEQTMIPKVNSFIENEATSNLLLSNSIYSVTTNVITTYEEEYKKTIGLFKPMTCQSIKVYFTIRFDIEHDDDNIFKLKDINTYDNLIRDKADGLYNKVKFDLITALYSVFSYDADKFA